MTRLSKTTISSTNVSKIRLRRSRKNYTLYMFWNAFHIDAARNGMMASPIRMKINIRARLRIKLETPFS